MKVLREKTKLEEDLHKARHELLAKMNAVQRGELLGSLDLETLEVILEYFIQYDDAEICESVKQAIEEKKNKTSS